MSGRWKYIEAPRPELYDIESDPSEKVNRIALEPAVASRMRSRLQGMLGPSGSLPRPDEPDEEANEQRQRLASLGYLPGAAGGGEPPGKLALDPKDAIGLVSKDRDPDVEAWVTVGGGLLVSLADRLGGLLDDAELTAISRQRQRWLFGEG